MGFGSFWDEHVVPRVIRFGCGQPAITELRREVVPLAQGHVFELGCGGGLNQALYDAARITDFSGLDPSGKLLDWTHAEAERKGWTADIRQGFGEAIPWADDSFDTVVCTYTLCSVRDQGQVLREMRRVLKPGGRLLYLEHGRAPDADVARTQARVEPVWKKLFGHCHLTREIGPAVERAGFTVTPLDARYLPGTPKFAGWMEWGTAVKSG